MLKLKNVSKFYYNNGVVASGFSKINLELNIGEFVAITGESGSGKSTLLNVISGLDSYEEGEMYINGEETSYYSENDFEEYRKKYIANIFQSFNLINSYTVYQNIELMFILNNMNDNTTKDKINELLEKVGLIKYKNTMVSKLSGGQKQRVAIARALAKNTPIIVADEPTGNLDSKSAKEIIKLLYEISKDKLVIIVTHNYDQVSDYVTRKIRMHDGKILEDTKLKKIKDSKYEEMNYGYPKFIDKFKLAFRNTFNIVPKFLLLLVVYTFLCIAIIGEYTSNLKSNYDTSFFGFNMYFKNKDDKRLIIKKNDLTNFTEEDYNKINSLEEVDYIIKNDVLLDTDVELVGEDDLYIYGISDNIDNLSGELDLGRMPENDKEVILSCHRYEYYLSDDLFDKEFNLINSQKNQSLIDYKLKVVGIKYLNDRDFTSDSIIYLNDSVITDISKSINSIYSKKIITLNKTEFNTDEYIEYDIHPSDKVARGNAFIQEDLSRFCEKYNCINSDIKIDISNLYYNDELNLKVTKIFNKNNFELITGLKKYDTYINTIFINSDDYYSLYDREPFQSSVFIKDIKKLDKVIKELNNLGYDTLHVKDTFVDFSEDLRVFSNLFKLIGIVIVLIALFFISYFVIKIILKSRNIYYSTVRILGASKTDIKDLLNIELINVLNISYLLIVVASILVVNNIIKFNYLKDLVTYLKITDYIILYFILFSMSLLISNRYSKSLFKKSAMSTYREV